MNIALLLLGIWVLVSQALSVYEDRESSAADHIASFTVLLAFWGLVYFSGIPTLF